MNIIETMITDLTSCIAVIKYMQREEPHMEALVISAPVWSKIYAQASPVYNPYVYIAKNGALYVCCVQLFCRVGT